MQSYFTQGKRAKSKNNPSGKHEGVTIRSWKGAANHFDVDFFSGGDYVNLIINLNGKPCKIKAKCNATRGDFYISKKDWEFYTQTEIFPLGTSAGIEILGIENLNGSQRVYTDKTNLKSEHDKLFKKWNNFSNRVRSRQPSLQKYCQYYKLDINKIKTQYKNPSIDHIISVYDSFKKGWSIEQTNSWDNLRILEQSENSSKGKKSLFEEKNSKLF